MVVASVTSCNLKSNGKWWLLFYSGETQEWLVESSGNSTLEKQKYSNVVLAKSQVGLFFFGLC